MTFITTIHYEMINNKLSLDYPYPIHHNSEPSYYSLWHNFLRIMKYDNRIDWAQKVDDILDTEYNAVRTICGLRFKSDLDRLMFVLRFS